MISSINYTPSTVVSSLIADEIIEPTAKTPFVKYDRISNYLVIKGASTKENMENFYDKILRDFKQNISKKRTEVLHLNFKTFNTSTAKVLFDLFRFFRDAQFTGSRVAIQWDVYDSEVEMIETARDFAELFDLKIKIR